MVDGDIHHQLTVTVVIVVAVVAVEFPGILIIVVCAVS